MLVKKPFEIVRSMGETAEHLLVPITLLRTNVTAMSIVTLCDTYALDWDSDHLSQARTVCPRKHITIMDVGL